MDNYQIKYYSKVKPGENHRAKYSKWEDEIILSRNKSDEEIALELGRTIRGIQVRRTHLVNRR